MRKTRRFSLAKAALGMSGATILLLVPAGVRSQKPPDAKPIVLRLHLSAVRNPEGISFMSDGKGGLKPVISQPAPMRKGEITVDGTNYALYLPAAKSYPLVNSGTDDTDFENKSAQLYIDSDNDGRVDRNEGWFVNMPIRIGDRLFEVKRIAKDGREIELLPSNKPLRGLATGRKCPPFRLLAQNGKVVSPETLKGKPFLLDVWSVT